MSTLVIVESPAKAKTIRKYLGDGYDVTASMGHIRDLPQNLLGIDVEHNYKPMYINIAGKEKTIKELKSKAAQSDAVLLATDPDREGEAISWHLANLLGLDTSQQNRVTFGEITKKGISEGMAHPRTIDMALFDAQQARRVLDRLVGYKLSPFLWKKVRRGLSAGRVQSVAVRLIVDREREIEAFIPEEYWNLDATLLAEGKQFVARLHTDAAGKRLQVTNAEQAEAITASLQGKPYSVKTVKKGKRKRSPAPPFITSTLQQEASRRFGFTGTRTMRAAQALYEGMEIKGHGTLGLITYMRTDSLRLADEAVDGAREYITGAFGAQYVYGKKRVYKRKGATNAQDAHEAIRPTLPSLTPDEVPWFVGRSLAYLGHSDPQGMSLRLAPLLKDARSESRHCYVLTDPERSPSAGVHVRAPEPFDDVQTLLLASPWHHDDRAALTRLIAELLDEHPHEAAVLELHSLDARRRGELEADLAGLGFVLDEVQQLRFELSEVPPIGVPLVLSAWTAAADRDFRAFHGAAEGRLLSDARWAYLKRRHGPFHPDLWFLAHETLDQEPVGYAFCGRSARRVDGRYTLDAVGVARALRSDSAMLRRLVISTLHELASSSPLGTVETEVSLRDGRLGDILRYVGFAPVMRSPVLAKRPA